MRCAASNCVVICMGGGGVKEVWGVLLATVLSPV